MSAPSPLWRAILRVERFLPQTWTIETPPQPPKRLRWVMLAGVLPGVAGAMIGYGSRGIQLSRDWLAVVMVGTLVVMAAALVAAVGFGIKAWREAHHA